MKRTWLLTALAMTLATCVAGQRQPSGRPVELTALPVTSVSARNGTANNVTSSATAVRPATNARKNGNRRVNVTAASAANATAPLPNANLTTPINPVNLQGATNATNAINTNTNTTIDASKFQSVSIFPALAAQLNTTDVDLSTPIDPSKLQSVPPLVPQVIAPPLPVPQNPITADPSQAQSIPPPAPPAPPAPANPVLDVPAAAQVPVSPPAAVNPPANPQDVPTSIDSNPVSQPEPQPQPAAPLAVPPTPPQIVVNNDNAQSASTPDNEGNTAPQNNSNAAPSPSQQPQPEQAQPDQAQPDQPQPDRPQQLETAPSDTVSDNSRNSSSSNANAQAAPSPTSDGNTAPSPTSNPLSQPEAITGISVGAVAFLALLVAGIAMAKRRRQAEQKEADALRRLEASSPAVTSLPMDNLPPLVPMKSEPHMTSPTTARRTSTVRQSNATDAWDRYLRNLVRPRTRTMSTAMSVDIPEQQDHDWMSQRMSPIRASYGSFHTVSPSHAGSPKSPQHKQVYE